MLTELSDRLALIIDAKTDGAVSSIRRLSTEEKAAADGKVLAEPAGREDGAQTRTSIASRNPSDRRLKAIEVRKIATPGSAGTQALT